MLGEKHEGVMDGKSVQLNVRVWYDARSGHIKLAGKGLTASTVSNDPDSLRSVSYTHLTLPTKA